MINLLNKFEITIREEDGDKVLKGVLRDFTKAEAKTFKDKNSELEKGQTVALKMLKELRRLEDSLELNKKMEKWEEVEKLNKKRYELEDKVESLGNPDEQLESILKERFELCLSGDDKATILEYAEKISYRAMFEAIGKAIAEGKQENSKTSKIG